MTIKKKLILCKDPIQDFEECEKELLARQKQLKRDHEFLKLSRIIKGTGMIHILVQCQIDDDAINALQEMELTTDEKFVTFLDEIEEFKKKVTFDKVDHLIAAATWIKEDGKIPSTHYKTAFTDEVMTSQLKHFRTKEQQKRQKKNKKRRSNGYISSQCVD